MRKQVSELTRNVISIHATIKRLTFRGDGLAIPDRDDIRPFPVAGALPGERVEIEEIPMKWGRRARLLQVLQPSPERVDPECEQDPRCRGCQLRAMTYERQKNHKEESWRRTLKRVANIELAAGKDERARAFEGRHTDGTGPLVTVSWEETELPDGTEGYRTRSSALVLDSSQDSGGSSESRRVLGMRPARGFKQPVDLTVCPAQHPECRALLAAAARMLHPEEQIVMVEVDVVPGHRRADGTWPKDRARVLLAGPGDCGRSAQAVRRETGASVFVAERDPEDTGPIEEQALFAGQYHLAIPGLDGTVMLAPPSAWIPTSHAIAKQLAGVLFDAIDQLVELSEAGESPTLTKQVQRDPLKRDPLKRELPPVWNRILEFGCGIGTHTFQLAHYAREVVGIDGSPAAIDAANLNRQRRLDIETHAATVDRVRFRLGRADHAVRQLLKKGMRGAELVVLHGMRKPYGSDVIDILPAWDCKLVVLVSPAALALAKDARALQDAGYQPIRFQMVDHMPQTYHAMGVMTFALAS